MSDPSSDPQAGRNSGGPALTQSPGLGENRAVVAQGSRSSTAGPSLPNGEHRELLETDWYSSTTELGAPFQIMMGQSSVSANATMTIIATPPSSNIDLRGAARHSSATAVEVRLRGEVPLREAPHASSYDPRDLPVFQTPPRRPYGIHGNSLSQSTSRAEPTTARRFLTQTTVSRSPRRCTTAYNHLDR